MTKRHGWSGVRAGSDDTSSRQVASVIAIRLTFLVIQQPLYARLSLSSSYALPLAFDDQFAQRLYRCLALLLCSIVLGLVARTCEP